jgi:hypothetical protein
MNAPETQDMMNCLEEICQLFLLPADQVVKVTRYCVIIYY